MRSVLASVQVRNAMMAAQPSGSVPLVEDPIVPVAGVDVAAATSELRELPKGEALPPKGLPQRCQDTRGTTESNNAGHAEGTSVAGSLSPAAAVECANPVGTEVEAWCAQRGRWRRAVVVATRHGELKLKFLGEGNAVRSAPLEARVMELESALAAEQGARLDAEGELARISGRAMPPRSVQVLSKSHQWRNCSVIAARRDPEAIRVHYEGFSEIFVSEPFLNFSASRTCLSRSVFLPRISRATNCRMSG